jgi:hypothetical protein
LIIKYDLTKADFILDVLGTVFDQVRNKYVLFEKFKEHHSTLIYHRATDQPFKDTKNLRQKSNKIEKRSTTKKRNKKRNGRSI